MRSGWLGERAYEGLGAGGGWQNHVPSAVYKQYAPDAFSNLKFASANSWLLIVEKYICIVARQRRSESESRSNEWRSVESGIILLSHTRLDPQTQRDMIACATVFFDTFTTSTSRSLLNFTFLHYPPI